MIEKEFDDHLDTEYPSIVNRFTKKLPLPPIVTLAFISSSIYLLHVVICRGCGEYERLINDWATPLGVFGGFYMFVVHLYLEKKVKNYYLILGQLTELKKESYQSFYERFIVSAFQGRNQVLFCLFFIIIVNITVIRMGLWYNSLLANFWLLIEMNVTIMGGVLNLWLMICTMLMIYKLGKKPLRINLFHHDGLGGLKAFGELSFSFFIFATVFVTIAAVIILFAPWKTITYYGASLLIVAYSIVIFSFFIPLLSVHKTLKNFKEEKLPAINDALMTHYNEITKSLSNNSYSKDIKNKLEWFLFVQGNVSKMKTWPFDHATIVKVIGGTIIPLASVLTKAGMFTTVLLIMGKNSQMG